MLTRLIRALPRRRRRSGWKSETEMSNYYYDSYVCVLLFRYCNEWYGFRERKKQEKEAARRRVTEDAERKKAEEEEV